MVNTKSKIQLIEKIQSTTLSTLIKNETVPETKRKLINIKRRLKNNELVQTYSYGTYTSKTGRQFPKPNDGLTTINNSIRKILVNENCLDIDMENCHFKILENLCDKYKIQIENIRYYNNNRKQILLDLQEKYNKTRSEIKEDFIIVLNGGKPIYIKEELVNKIKEERDNVLICFKSIKDFDKIKIVNLKICKIENITLEKKIDTKFLSRVLYTYENKCLMCMYDVCCLEDIQVCSLIYDGMLIYKGRYDVKEIIKEMEEEIKKQLNFDMTITEKSMKIKNRIKEDTDEETKNIFNSMLIDNEISISDESLCNAILYMFPNTFVYSHRQLYMLNEVGIYTNITEEIKQLQSFKMKLNLAVRRYLQNESDYLILFDNMCRSSKSSYTIMDVIKTKVCDETFYDKLNNNMFLIGYENGVYDLKNKEFRKGRPKDFISSDKTTGKNFIEATEDEIQDASDLISSMMLNEDNVEPFFILTSSFLLKENICELLYFLIGSGGNGKGLLMRILKAMLGDKLITDMNNKYFIESKNNYSRAPDSELMRTKNCNFALVSEIKNGDIFDEAPLKQISGRDSLSCRGLYKDTITIETNFKTIFTSQQNPKFNQTDGGLQRRLVVIPFDVSFVENPTEPHERKIDTTIKDRTEELARGLFHILVNDYLPIYIKNNFKIDIPEEWKNATDELKKDIDEFGSFCKELVPGGKIKISDIKTILEEEFGYKIDTNQITKNLKKLLKNVETVRVRTNYSRERYVKNWSLPDKWKYLETEDDDLE